MNAWTTDTTPLTKSHAAKKIAMVISVAAVWVIARMPMMMLRIPMHRTRPQWDPTCRITSCAESTVLVAPAMAICLPSVVPAG